MPLENRRVFYPWSNRYQAVKKTLKNCIPEWKTQLLQMGKESLKIPQDIEACLYMDNLSQFETYINTSYIAGMSMIDDLLSELIKKAPPKTYNDSIKNMTEALVVKKSVKQKKLTGKVTERHLEQVIECNLLRTDIKEYRKEWAKARFKHCRKLRRRSRCYLSGQP